MSTQSFGLESRQLPCRVTSEERLQFGIEAGRLNGDIARETEKFESVKSEYKAKIGGMTASLNSTLHVVETGQQMRDVEVERIADYALGEMRFTRTDTGEVIDSRKLSDKEMQRRFEFEKESVSRYATLDLGGDRPA